MFDMAEINNIISVGISDLKVSTAPNILATYALGSCVGICLLDAKKHIGGLAHIMLPWSVDAKTNNENTRKYADTGIKELIDTMLKYGADGGKYELLDIPADMVDQAEEYRNSLIETAAENDEKLMEKYFEQNYPRNYLPKRKRRNY